MVILGSVAAAWEPSDEARQMMADLHDAIIRARRQIKAGTLGYSHGILSRLLNLQLPNLAAKLADHPDIERELIQLRAARLGLRVIDADLARAIEAGNKHMAKIEQLEKKARVA